MSVAATRKTLRASSTELPLRVLIFGPLRSLLETDVCKLSFPADGSVEEFWRELIACYPAIAAARFTTRLAREGEFLAEGDRLKPGDEIALIPPVSGG